MGTRRYPELSASSGQRAGGEYGRVTARARTHSRKKVPIYPDERRRAAAAPKPPPNPKSRRKAFGKCRPPLLGHALEDRARACANARTRSRAEGRRRSTVRFALRYLRGRRFRLREAIVNEPHARAVAFGDEVPRQGRARPDGIPVFRIGPDAPRPPSTSAAFVSLKPTCKQLYAPYRCRDRPRPCSDGVGWVLGESVWGSR